MVHYHAGFLIVLNDPPKDDIPPELDMRQEKERRTAYDYFAKSIVTPFIHSMDKSGMTSTGGSYAGFNAGTGEVKSHVGGWVYQCKCARVNAKPYVRVRLADGSFMTKAAVDTSASRAQAEIPPCPAQIGIQLYCLQKGRKYRKDKNARQILTLLKRPFSHEIENNMYFLRVDQLFDHLHPLCSFDALQQRKVAVDMK